VLKEGTLKKAAIGLVLVAGVATGFWNARWYAFMYWIGGTVERLPNKPDQARLLGLRGEIRDDARRLWIEPDALALDIHLEQHSSNGFATKEDMTEYYWFVVVHAARGSKVADWERRIDNKLDEAELAALEAGGVGVHRRSRGGS